MRPFPLAVVCASALSGCWFFPEPFEPPVRDVRIYEKILRAQRDPEAFAFPEHPCWTYARTNRLVELWITDPKWIAVEDREKKYRSVFQFWFEGEELESFRLVRERFEYRIGLFDVSMVLEIDYKSGEKSAQKTVYCRGKPGAETVEMDYGDAVRLIGDFERDFIAETAGVHPLPQTVRSGEHIFF